jgi:hypothetical protein
MKWTTGRYIDTFVIFRYKGTSSIYVMVNVYQRQYVYSMCGGDRDVTTYNGKFTMGKLKSSRLSWNL